MKARAPVFFLSLLLGVTSHAAQKPLLVIVDIDDTIKISQVQSRGNYRSKLRKLLIDNRAFSGAWDVLHELDQGGAEIAYVSAATDAINFIPIHFLKRNFFPQRENLYLRPNSQISTFEFKVKQIRKLLAAHPDRSVIFIGDNGQADVDVYHAFARSPFFRGRILATYIHWLYKGDPADTLEKEQIPFVTFAEVAMSFRKQGLMNESDVLYLIKRLSLEIENPKLATDVLPDFIELNSKDIDQVQSVICPVGEIDVLCAHFSEFMQQVKTAL